MIMDMGYVDVDMSDLMALCGELCEAADALRDGDDRSMDKLNALLPGAGGDFSDANWPNVRAELREKVMERVKSANKTMTIQYGTRTRARPI